GPLRSFIDAKLENVRASIMTGDVQIELAAHDLTRINLGGEDRFFVVNGAGQQLAEGRHDAGSAPNEDLMGIVAKDSRKISRTIPPPQDLAGRKDKAAAFAGNMPHGRNPTVAIIDGGCAVELYSFGIHCCPEERHVILPADYCTEFAQRRVQ